MPTSSTFDNPLAPDSDKNSEAYGLRFLTTAYERWRVGSAESAGDRRRRFEYNRSYAFGMQDMAEFKDILDLDGQMSVINLAFDPSPIAIPFINRLKDRYLQRIEKIQCNAVDPLSQTKKEKDKADALFKLKNKEQIMELQQMSGVQLEEFNEDDPETEAEIDIEFGFNYKQREEVIMEQGIDLVFYDNNWSDVIKDRILTDLINCGISMVCPYIDPNGRIKTPFEKPENIISGYAERDDLEDAQYMGRCTQMSIMDIRLKYPNKISEEKLFELARSQKGVNGNANEWSWDWNPNYEFALARPYDSFTVTTVQMSLKTLYGLKYKVWDDKFGNEKLTKVEWFSKEEEGFKYKKSKPYYVEYFGIYIVDTSYVLEWGLAKNMIKPQDNLTEVRLPYVVYMYNNHKMVNKPMIETMIPSIKIMQLVALQQQKIIAAAAPDGFEVDISTMSDITLGQDLKNLSPFDIYRIYKQTGIQYYKRKEDDGEGQRQAPIQPKNVPFSDKLNQLMGVWNAEYDKLMRIVGTNNLAEGQLSNQAVGKQVLQDARQIGESASNYIYNAYLNMYKRTAKIVQMRLWDILVYGKKDGITYYDGYRQALGSDRIEYIRVEGTDDFERAQFDVKIEAIIDDSEAQMLEQNIQVCLANDTITLQDAIDVRLISKSNIKYASYMLASRDKKRRKAKMEEGLVQSQANTQAAIEAAKAKSQGEMELEQLKAQLQSQTRLDEIEALKSSESIKFTQIAKVEVIKSILNKEGGSVNQIPAWALEGIEQTNALSGALLDQQMQDVAMEQEEMAMQQEQMMQEQMAQEQGGMEQMQGQEEMPQEEMMQQ
jgi:hypothetical protein